MKQVRDITKIARELAEGNPLGYNKIRAMLKKAAPLMLEALKRVVEECEGHTFGPLGSRGRARVIAQAAINAVEGKVGK